MADDSLQQQLRKALSYRVKVQRLENESKEALQKGKVDQERFDALREFYFGHQKRAEQSIQGIRRKIQNRLVALDDETREVIDKQADLGQRVTAGQIDTDIANRRNREYQQRLSAKQEEQRLLTRIVGGDDPAQVGGFIDLPLEDYAKSARRFSPSVVRMSRALAFFVPFVAAAMVFLPWVEIGNTPYSLRTIGGLLPAALSLRNPVVGLVWLIYFLLPLLSLLFTALSSHKRAGQGVIAMGVASLLAVFAGMTALPMVATNASVTPVAVITGLGAGALGYMVGALALLFIGRARLNEGLAGAERFGLPFALAATVAMVIIGSLGIIGSTIGGAVAASATMISSAEGRIEVTFHNASSTVVTAQMPWPGSPGGGMGDHFGVSVYVREQGSTDFRYLPQSENCWDYAGVPIGPGNSVQLGPQRSASVIFDARYLRQLDIHPDSIRLVMTNSFSEVLGMYDFNMPANLPPPPPQTRAMESQRAQPSWGTDSYVSEAPRSAPTTPAEKAREPAKQAVVYSVRIVGLVPSRDDIPSVILEAVSPDGTRERITAKEGDSILGGWYVERIEGRDGVVLESLRGDASLRIPSRTTVSVPAG